MCTQVEVVVIESHTAHTYLEAPRDTGAYSDVFNHLRAAALDPLGTQSLIREIAGQIAD